MPVDSDAVNDRVTLATTIPAADLDLIESMLAAGGHGSIPSLLNQALRRYADHLQIGEMGRDAFALAKGRR